MRFQRIAILTSLQPSRRLRSPAMSLFRKSGNYFRYGSMASAALLSGVMMFSTLASAQTAAAAASLSPTGLNRWTTSGSEGGFVTSLVPQLTQSGAEHCCLTERSRVRADEHASQLESMKSP